VGQEKMNMVNEKVIKAVGSLAGGIASSSRACGCLLGGVALLSSLYSRGNLNEKEDPRMWQLGKKLVERFEELSAPFGGVNCRDIARMDWTDKGPFIGCKRSFIFIDR
jgi:Putative redox-active protein (C_GCAxxG_C_C)